MISLKLTPDSRHEKKLKNWLEILAEKIEDNNFYCIPFFLDKSRYPKRLSQQY